MTSEHEPSVAHAPANADTDPSQQNLFSISPALRQRLDLIHHLVEFGNRLVVVQGPRPSERSRLVEAVGDEAEATWTVLQPSGVSLDSAAALRDFIAGALNIEARADDGSDAESAIANALASLEVDNELCVLVVDDADQLDQDVLELMFRLAHTPDSTGRLRVILSGGSDPSFGQRVQALSPAQALVHVIDVPEVHAVQTAEPEPPSMTGEIAPGLTEAGGADTPVQGPPPNSGATKSHTGARAVGALVAVLIVLAVAVALLLRSPTSDDGRELLDLELPADRAIAPATIVTDAPVQTDDPRGPAVSPTPPSPLAAPDSASEPGTTDDESPVESASTDAEVADTEASTAPEAEAGTPAVEPTPAKPAVPNDAATADPPAGSAETPLDFPVEVEPADEPETLEPASAAAPEVVPTNVAEQTADSEPLATPPAAETPPEAITVPATSAPRSAPATLGLPSGELYSEKWVLTRSPESYVIQLFGVRERAGAVRFLRSHPEAQPAAIIALQHEGAPWFVVVTGHFPDRDAARAAIGTLPADLAGFNPWARPVRSLEE